MCAHACGQQRHQQTRQGLREVIEQGDHAHGFAEILGRNHPLADAAHVDVEHLVEADDQQETHHIAGQIRTQCTDEGASGDHRVSEPAQ
ncbi:hypothetical protein D3C81_1882100 [compost metagenome]